MPSDRQTSRPLPPPPALALPAREEQALREVGRTEISRPVVWLLVVLFLATVGGVLAVERIAEARAGRADAGGGIWPAWREVGVRVAERWRGEGALAANRVVLAEIAAFEERVDERSVLVRHVAPWVQWAETAVLGSGNRQVEMGVGGGAERWLFYRPDVVYVTGPPFLAADQQEARRAAAPSWESAPATDPRPALLAFDRELAARGIDLVVVPTPVKPVIHPEYLTGGRPEHLAGGGAWELPLQNPSFARLVGELEAAGVEVFDPAPLLAAAARESGEAQYLAADTHWTPAAMGRVAAALAERLRGRLELPDAAPAESPYLRRPVTVAGTGDITRMLELPEGAALLPPQEVTVDLVTTGDGGSWRPERGAPVLLLGDSFTNVFSQAELGWGRGAGLAEQLSYHLGRPIDRVAVNAGGSHTTREALARQPGRLDGVRVVVYQFSVRELAQGDWKLLELPPPGPGR